MNWLQFVPAMTNIMGTYLSVSGNKSAAGAASAAGQLQLKEAQFEAEQLTGQASDVVGAAQAEATDIRRKTTLENSRALAVAAAGGSASDPTVARLIARNAAFGSYNEAVALYNGQARARLLRADALTRAYEGKVAAVTGQARAASYDLAATASVLKGASSLYEKYGSMPKTPSTAGQTDFSAPTTQVSLEG
ncbi:MAG TPA: hypothetical protein VF151_10880 [Gemmatimonadales bacterium]